VGFLTSRFRGWARQHECERPDQTGLRSSGIQGERAGWQDERLLADLRRSARGGSPSRGARFVGTRGSFRGWNCTECAGGRSTDRCPLPRDVFGLERHSAVGSEQTQSVSCEKGGRVDRGEPGRADSSRTQMTSAHCDLRHVRVLNSQGWRAEVFQGSAPRDSRQWSQGALRQRLGLALVFGGAPWG